MQLDNISVEDATHIVQITLLFFNVASHVSIIVPPTHETSKANQRKSWYLNSVLTKDGQTDW